MVLIHKFLLNIGTILLHLLGLCKNQWKYPIQPIQPPYQPFQNHPPMKNAQWTNTPQGYRPPNQQQQALFPPPPQPNNTHISVVPQPPKQPQFPTQPISN